MQKDIKQFYEEYKKGMDNFKREEERIKKEKNEIKRAERLNRLNERKMKFIMKYAKPFLNENIKTKKKGKKDE
ncbi:MAG: hypothetical protein IJ223_06850 [Clostridia bacterium]|nr:hypothetical protein [Clostridia bacterium]